MEQGNCRQISTLKMNAETAKTKSIVFVEDNPVVLMAYKNRLQREGYHVEPAQDDIVPGDERMPVNRRGVAGRGAEQQDRTEKAKLQRAFHRLELRVLLPNQSRTETF